MIGKTERVVLVQGDADKWYEQAIFIVNPAAEGKMPVDFVAEAEKIIDEYNLKRAAKRNSSTIVPHASPVAQNSAGANFAPTELEKEKNPTGRKIRPVGLLMIFACIIIAAIFTFGLLR